MCLGRAEQWFERKEANKFQIWSHAVLCEVALSDTFPLANVFSREGRGPAILNRVQRNGFLLLSTILRPKLKLRMWASSFRLLDACVKCLLTRFRDERHSVLDHAGYPRTTKAALGTHAKVHDWTEPFSKWMEFWGKNSSSHINPSTLRWDNLSWSSPSCTPPALHLLPVGARTPAQV